MKRSVLIVEDDGDLSNFLQAFLSLKGFETHVAANGRDGVSLAKKLSPDIITMDVMLPQLNGLEACRLIKSDPALAKTPILVVTALSTMGDAREAFTAGADDYLAKPFEPEHLLAKIQKMLGP